MTTHLDLDDYESAFERVGHRLQLERDWGLTEARIRHRLRRPSWRLVRTLLFIAVCVVFALGSGGLRGWGMAIGIALAVVPGRVADIKQRRRAMAAVQSAADVRALCAEESRGRFVGSVMRLLLLLLLGALYLVVGLVAWLLGKTPWPGVVAGLALLVYSAVQFFVVLPHAARERAVFEDDDETEDDDDD